MKKILVLIFPGAQVLLFSAYPFIFLLARNPHYQIESDFWALLLTVFLSSLFAWGAFSVFLRDADKAALMVSGFLLFFFSFGALSEGVSGWRIQNVWIGSPRNVFVFCLLIWASLSYRVLKLKKTEHLTQVVTLMALFLTAVNIIPYGHYKLNSDQEQTVAEEIFEYQVPRKPPPKEWLPDVYYIIPDMFARADILNDLFRFNGEALTREFERRGFYVAQKSTGNYIFSLLSIGAALNMNYWDKVTDAPISDIRKEEMIARINQQNLVMKTFEELGYKTVVFSSGYFGTDIRKADVVIRTKDYETEFQSLLFKMTPFNLISASAKAAGGLNSHERMRRRVLDYFKKIPEIAEWEEPTFTFVHLLSPHWPFIFGPNGEAVTPRKDIYSGIHGESKEYIEQYRAQTEFITKKILETVDLILAKSDKPPIIIIQSDHGPDVSLDYFNPSLQGIFERISIFNAYYLPYGGEKLLYKNITPVNTFRLIFNYYFGTAYSLLPDKNYFSFPRTPESNSSVKAVQDITPIVQPRQILGE